MKNLIPILTIFFALLSAAEKENNNGGFTIELIHRDSPNSPLYNPLLSQWQRINFAFQDSVNRAGINFSGSVPVIPDPKGTYLIRLSVGATPAVRLAVADTGSDLIWLQCCRRSRRRHCISAAESLSTGARKVITPWGSDSRCPEQKQNGAVYERETSEKVITPCESDSCCPDQEQNGTVFDTGTSVTYETVDCRSEECTGLPGTRCDRENDTCRYSATYNDGSFSYGEVATDTFTLDLVSGGTPANVSFTNIVFGCGYKNHFANNDSKISGIVGLGSSPYSFINQIGGGGGGGGGEGGGFSYCLVPLSHLNVSSKLHFGRRSTTVQGRPGVVSTPLILKPPRIFYYLTLLGISVGNQTVEFLDESLRANHKGNIFIDSGTTFSFLPLDLYLKLEKMVKKSITLKPMKPNPRRFLRLCYKDLEAKDVPLITVKFEGGDLKLNPVNIFVNIGDGIGCLGFAPTKGIPVFGNVAHTNFLVEYDLEKMVVSFMATNCVKWKY